MVLYVNNYNAIKEEEQEAQLYLNYQNAYLTSIFVNNALNGKKSPSFYDLYPQFKKQTDEEKGMSLYKEQFLFFAEQHNAKRKGA